MKAINENQNGESKNGNTIEKVAALVDGYLLGCALAFRDEQVGFYNDTLLKIRSVLDPEYEEVDEKVSRLFDQVRDALPTKEAKGVHGDLDDTHNHREALCSDAGVIAGIVLGLRLAGASPEQIVRMGKVYLEMNHEAA